jgi:hypothetical protein
MSTTRRGFIQAGAAALGAMGLGAMQHAAAAPSPSGKTAGKSLSILILGGTGFIGPTWCRLPWTGATR